MIRCRRTLFQPSQNGKISGTIHGEDILKRAANGNLLVFELIHHGAMEQSAKLYCELFKKCTNEGKIKEGGMVHAHFLTSRFQSSSVLQNMVINMYAKAGNMEIARKVFDEMIGRDMVSYTMLVSGYSQNNECEQALKVYKDMMVMGFRPNRFTLSSALKAAGGMESDEMGRMIHGHCVKEGYDENLYVGSALVDVYTRCRRMGDAKIVFDGLKTRNEVCWNSLIAGYAREGEAPEALQVFREMKRGGLDPTDFTYSSIFAACAEAGALEPGKWAHADMLKSGMNLVAFVGNTLLRMYGKGGSIVDAKKVFDHLVNKELVSWNSMLTAYAQHGLGREAVNLFEEMLSLGYEPDNISFLGVISACSHAGLLDKGLHYFNLMKEYNLEPEITHYVTLVDLLGRAGKLDRAMRYIKEMKIQPTADIWKALLGACRMHKNMELGALAAERIFELDPYDSGPHVLLSNMYASAGRLRDALRVRRVMSDGGVKKEPGCSWLEIGNAVHIFVANDGSHPRRDEIRSVWEKLREESKKLGYVTDTTQAVWGADEQEREEMLQYHSEKLAVAFALIVTPPGVPISIKKNIRVCGDCHTAFKFVSRLVDREITLRDTRRFHHFRHGHCSCGDFW